MSSRAQAVRQFATGILLLLSFVPSAHTPRVAAAQRLESDTTIAALSTPTSARAVMGESSAVATPSHSDAQKRSAPSDDPVATSLVMVGVVCMTVIAVALLVGFGRVLFGHH